jgi:membrane associated rhomboid family serine protease
MPLGETVRDPRILLFLALWVAINAYFGLSAVRIPGQEGGIAWEAHIGGFLFGLLTFGFFDTENRPTNEERRIV